jgi:hypothetical protein
MVEWPGAIAVGAGLKSSLVKQGFNTVTQPARRPPRWRENITLTRSDGRTFFYFRSRSAGI